MMTIISNPSSNKTSIGINKKDNQNNKSELHSNLFSRPQKNEQEEIIHFLKQVCPSSFMDEKCILSMSLYKRVFENTLKAKDIADFFYENRDELFIDVLFNTPADVSLLFYELMKVDHAIFDHHKDLQIFAVNFLVQKIIDLDIFDNQLPWGDLFTRYSFYNNFIEENKDKENLTTQEQQDVRDYKNKLTITDLMIAFYCTRKGFDYFIEKHPEAFATLRLRIQNRCISSFQMNKLELQIYNKIAEGFCLFQNTPYLNNFLKMSNESDENLTLIYSDLMEMGKIKTPSNWTYLYKKIAMHELFLFLKKFAPQYSTKLIRNITKSLFDKFENWLMFNCIVEQYPYKIKEIFFHVAYLASQKAN